MIDSPSDRWRAFIAAQISGDKQVLAEYQSWLDAEVAERDSLLPCSPDELRDYYAKDKERAIAQDPCKLP
jgi:hypothetical protein